MPITAPLGGTKSEPVTAGAHHAICYGVVAIGTQPTVSKEYAAKKKVTLLWELPNERADFGEKKDQVRVVSRSYTLSMNPKASLRKDLENWRGRPFTDEEAVKFDISTLMGANCMLNVVHEERGGSVYANVAAIMPLPKGMPKKTNENPPLYFNVEEGIEAALMKHAADLEYPANLPPWIIERIKKSGEYLAYTGKAAEAKSNNGTQIGPKPVAEVQGELSKDVPF